jgi:hypothetical protein
MRNYTANDGPSGKEVLIIEIFGKFSAWANLPINGPLPIFFDNILILPFQSQINIWERHVVVFVRKMRNALHRKNEIDKIVQQT